MDAGIEKAGGDKGVDDGPEKAGGDKGVDDGIEAQEDQETDNLSDYNDDSFDNTWELSDTEEENIVLPKIPDNINKRLDSLLHRRSLTM